LMLSCSNFLVGSDIRGNDTDSELRKESVCNARSLIYYSQKKTSWRPTVEGSGKVETKC
jgi:hypothetical protein